MSVFDQLRPFVSLCQACGMFPHTIEENLTTKKFAKFSFSFRRAITWWFFIVLSLQVAVTVIVVYSSMEQMVNLTSDRNMPITITILLVVNWPCFLIQMFTCRWIAFHHRRLRIVIATLQEVERLFGEKCITTHKNSIAKRFTIGFILIVIMSIGVLVVMAPVFNSYSGVADMNWIFVAALLSVATSISVMFDSTFLLIHLSYYIIAHYTWLILREPIEKDDELHQTPGERTRRMEWLRRNMLIFDYICRATTELNNIYSFPVFYILSTKFIFVVTVAFGHLQNTIQPNVVLENYWLMYPFHFVMDWFRILVVLSAADMPANQVRLLRERVIATSCSGFFQTLHENISVATTLMQIDESRVRLSSFGLFNVGTHLIPAVQPSLTWLFFFRINKSKTSCVSVEDGVYLAHSTRELHQALVLHPRGF